MAIRLEKAGSRLSSWAAAVAIAVERLPGAKRLLPSRKYGTPVNFKAIQENLTLASLISRSDAALAHYCGLDASVKHRIDEQKEARAMAAKALQMRTERLRETNERAAKTREQQFISGINPMTGRYF